MKEVQKTFQLDKIIIVPSHFPPGKAASAPFEKRLEWAKKNFTERYFEICDFERTSSQTLFGKDIFYFLSTKYPTAYFYWILGEDQWNQLAYWKDIKAYGELLEWIVLSRGIGGKNFEGLLSRRLLTTTCSYRSASSRSLSQISSTKIRKCIEQNKLKSTAIRWVPRNIRKDVIETYRRKKEVV